MSRLLRMRRDLAVALAVLSVGGCCEISKTFDPSHDCRQDDVGSSHIAILSAGRWTNYRDALSPDFNLTAEQALAAAVPNTSDLEVKTVDALSGSLKVALPTGGTAGDTSKLTFGSSPNNGVAASSIGPAASVLAAPTAIDPFLRYGAATALKQEVTLLNSYLKDAASDPDYEPYLVRLQVSLMPRHRDAPYDAYVSMAFFPGAFDPAVSIGTPIAPENFDRTLADAVARAGMNETQKLKQSALAYAAQKKKIAQARYSQTSSEVTGWASAISDIEAMKDSEETTATSEKLRKTIAAASAGFGVKVIPLIVTDDVEMSSHSESTDRIRQFALALSAIIQGVGIGGELQKLDENLRTLLGHDFNSVFTVARASENTLRVRFGALQQVNHQYAMVPQTHNVTVLILVPKAELNSLNGGKIRVVGKTVFARVKDGSELMGRPPEELVQRVRAVMEPYFGDSVKSLDAAHSSAIVSAVDFNDRAAFDLAVANVVGAGKMTQPESLWVDMVSLRTGGQFNFQSFHVPAPRQPQIDKDQLATIVDDPTGAATATIYGNRDLDAAKLRARLVVTPVPKNEEPGPPTTDSATKPSAPSAQTVNLAATSIKVTDSGRQAVFTFPSLAKLKLDKDREFKLLVDNEENSSSPSEIRCSAVLLPSSDKPKSKLFVGAKYINADSRGAGTMELAIAAAPGETVTFTIDGADVGAPLDASGRPSSGIILRQNESTTPGAQPKQVADIGWLVKGDGVVILPLSNLTELSPVTVQAKVKRPGDSGDPISLSPISLQVTRQHSEFKVSPP